MQPSHEERTFAALTHASILANITGLLGLIATGMIWATQRQRSHYIATHAIQALWYQAGVVLGMLVLLFSWGGCMALALLPMALRPELYNDGSLPGPFWLALSTVLIPLIFGLLTTIYALFGAIQAYRGHAFHYPFMRRMAEREANPIENSALVSPQPDPVQVLPEALPDSDAQQEQSTTPPTDEAAIVQASKSEG